MRPRSKRAASECVHACDVERSEIAAEGSISASSNLIGAETRRPWVINESNTHTLDSRKACQDYCGFTMSLLLQKAFALNRANRHRLYESSSTRGTDKTPAGFHHRQEP